ncbi:MAG: lysostaphin resistance A-like protein [Planctomycetota bacterium]
MIGGILVALAFLMSYNYTFVVVNHVESQYTPPGESPGFDFLEPVWVNRAPVDEVLHPFAVIFTMLVLALLFFGLGTANTELSQVGWSMEWLFTLPVPTRGLLLAKVGEYGLTSIFTWFTVFPLTSTILWSAGWGVWGFVLGAIAALLIALSNAAARVLIETYLRKRLSRHKVKNIQALCTIAGMVLLFTVFGLLARGKPPEILFRAGDAVGSVLLYFPAAAVLLVAKSLGGAVILLAWSIAIIGLCLAGAEALVSDGLLAAGGPYQGERRPRRGGARGIGGILGKDLHLLLRDRNFMMQTLVVPLIIVAFQLIVNPALTSGGSTRATAVLAFGVGAYVLAFGGFSILTAERSALWLLYSLPRRLDRLFLRKTVLWGGVAIAYASALLAITWRPSGSMTALEWAMPLFVILGVLLHAFLAGAMGMLGIDPLEREWQKKVRAEWSMLYMVIASAYGFTLAKGNMWHVVVVHTLLGLLVFAMWERVRLRLPYLLDPSASPVRRIEASDGLIGVFVLFGLQQVLFFVALALGASPSASQATAYFAASVITVCVILYSFWRLKVRDVVIDIGLRLPRAAPIFSGAAVGLAVAGIGLVDLRLIDANPVFQSVREAGEEAFPNEPGARVAIACVAVLIAPFIEEFLFRGLVLRGLQRAMRLPFAVLGSALAFAVVHPPASFAPVFLLGVAAALVFARTGVLWAAVATHATYNAVVVFFQLS